jgi:hypothetical protein
MGFCISGRERRCVLLAMLKLPAVLVPAGFVESVHMDDRLAPTALSAACRGDQLEEVWALLSVCHGELFELRTTSSFSPF